MALLLLLWIGQVDKVNLDWYHSTVYPRTEHQKLKFNDVVVGEFQKGATVVKVEGDLLHIQHKHTAALDDASRKKVVPFIAHVKISEVVRSRDAESFYTAYLQNHPSSAWAYVHRGTVLAGRGDDKRAFADFDEAIRLRPCAGSYNARGWGWLARERFDRAVADFSKAIELEPDDYAGYFGRAFAQSLKKKYDEAIRDYSEAIKRDPFDAPSYHNRAINLHHLRKVDDAIADLTKAIRLDPQNWVHFHERGELFREKKEYGKALDDYKSAIPFVIFEVDPYYRASWIRATCPDARFRDGKAAVDYAKKALKVEGRNPDYLGALAAAYAEAGDFDAAVKSQQRVIDQLWNSKENWKAIFAAKERLNQYMEKKPFRDEAK